MWIIPLAISIYAAYRLATDLKEIPEGTSGLAASIIKASNTSVLIIWSAVMVFVWIFYFTYS